MNQAYESSRFHLHHAWFNLREQFADLPSAIAANALVPFFVWLLSRIWLRFNSAQAHFTLEEIVIYIGITELLFMTFVRLPALTRASGDFSIALARPRSWIMTSLSGFVGRATGTRFLMLVMMIVTSPFLGARLDHLVMPVLRFMILLPWLGVLQALFSLIFACAQVLWHQTNYFLLPFGKIFLVLGGVWGPVADFSQPWKGWILILPPADLFFQPVYFCVKGEFYGISALTWFLRTFALAVALIFLNLYFFRVAKTRHQSYGG